MFTFTAMTLLAIWLILMGAQQLGVNFPRWVIVGMGVGAIIAGLMLLGGL